MVILPTNPESDINRSGIRRHVCMIWSMWKRMLPLITLFMLLCPADADVKKKGDEKKKAEAYAPEVRDVSASFVAGQSVDIELSASVGTLKQVEFIIRQAPQNGTLSAVRPHPRDTNKGIVTYTHRDRSAPLTDRFTFAGRVDGGPLSTPGTVTLTGRGFDAKLEILEVTVADRVFTGGESTIKITLKNSGSAPFSKDMSWEAPWRGPPHIELNAGEKADFIIVFKPAKTGVFRSNLELQPGVETSKLLLYGECVRALTVSPGRLQLNFNSQTGAREGTLSLSNGRSEPLHVEIRTPKRLEGGGIFDVPGAGKITVPLRLPSTDVEAFHGDVTISTPEGLETVTADAEAKAQELRIIAPANGALDFGRIEVGATANGEIRLQNSGGTPAIVEAQAFPPLIVTPAHQTLRVEPGAIIAFGVSLKGEQTGGFQSEVRIAGAGDLIRVPVKVEVLPVKSTTPPEPLPPPSVTPSVTPSPKTPDPAPPQIDKRTASDSDIALQQKVLGYLRSNGLPVPKDKINPYLERVKQVSILDQTTSSITLTWKKPEIMPAKWDVEASEMVFSPTSKDVMKLWKTFKSWEPVDAGTDKIAIRLHTLPDAAKIEIRIMGVDREGKVSEPSAPIILETLPSWKFPSWFWNLLIAVALLVVVYYLVRIRRGDFSK